MFNALLPRSLNNEYRGSRSALWLSDLPRLLESANMEERKLVMQAFIAGITVQPEEACLDLLVRPLPVIATADSTVRLVAGAGFEPATFGL